MGHHLTTVDGFLQNGCQLHGQARESYKHILLVCEHKTLGEGGYLRVYDQVKKKMQYLGTRSLNS